MDLIRKQIRRAQWWLGAQRFVHALGWCWFGTLALAAVLVGVDKWWPLGIEAWALAAGALGAGGVLAGGWAWFRGRGPLDAALEIDRRYRLKERISSALALEEQQRQTPVGQALVADAQRQAVRIDLAEQFAFRPPRHLLLPLLPAVAVFLIALLVPAAGDRTAEGRVDPQATRQQMEKSQAKLQAQLAEKRQQARQEGLKEAQDLFLRLERELAEASKTLGDRNDALSKLHDLSQMLEKRRQELGGAEAVEKQLEQLKNLSRGPADRVLAALTKGDMKLAQRELEALRKQLAEGKLDPQGREALARQLAEAQKKLENLVQAHRQAEEALAKQVEQLRKEGQHAQAEKLLEQLRQLQAQRPQMKQLEELARKLGRCAQAMEGGQTDQAAKTLEEMQADLEALREQLGEFEMIQEAMDELDAARRRMLCPHCGGEGCEQCQGDLWAEGPGGNKGRGADPRPEEENPVSFYDTRTPAKVRPGAATVVGEVEGPIVKGLVRQQILEQVQAARSQPADPLTDQRMSRKHRQHAQEYFDKFRQGQ